MRYIEQYVSLIIRIIYRSIAVDDKVTYSVDSPLTGTIDGILYFQDGSRLEFTALPRRRLGRAAFSIRRSRPIGHRARAGSYPE
jgi:hypothetical protein